jgi:hypothetical protein
VAVFSAIALISGCARHSEDPRTLTREEWSSIAVRHDETKEDAGQKTPRTGKVPGVQMGSDEGEGKFDTETDSF